MLPSILVELRKGSASEAKSFLLHLFLSRFAVGRCSGRAAIVLDQAERRCVLHFCYDVTPALSVSIFSEVSGQQVQRESCCDQRVKWEC